MVQEGAFVGFVFGVEGFDGRGDDWRGSLLGGRGIGAGGFEIRGDFGGAGFEAVDGAVHLAEAGGFEAMEAQESGAGVDIEAEAGGVAFQGVEGVQGLGFQVFEGGDFAGDEGGGLVEKGVEVAEFGRGAEEVEGEGFLGFGPGGGEGEDGGEGEPSFEEPLAALAGVAELAEDDAGLFGEACAEEFGGFAAVFVPAQGGAEGDVGAEGGFVLDAAVDADGVDDDLGVVPVVDGGVQGGGEAISPGVEAFGDEGGFFAGEERGHGGVVLGW